MEIPDQMNAVRLLGPGDVDQLHYGLVATPRLASGEVLIRVTAAALNRSDIVARTAEKPLPAGGKESAFPRIQGADVCGIIVRISKGIDPGRVGQRVLLDPCLRPQQHGSLYDAGYLGTTCDGGFADYVKVPANCAYTVASSLTDAELASFPVSCSTAENLLRHAGVGAGDTVLVTGASGAVGSATVQLAKRRRARVIAIASTAGAHTVMALGADNVIPRGTSPQAALGDRSVDVVIDVVGGALWPELLAVLVCGGRYATPGTRTAAPIGMDLNILANHNLSLFGCTGHTADVFRDLIGYIERREIRPLVASTYSLPDMAQAQQDLMARKKVGKPILMPTQPIAP